MQNTLEYLASDLQMVISRIAVQEFRDSMERLPECDRMLIEGWQLNSSNRVQHVGPIVVTNTAHLQAFSKAVLSGPLVVDNPRSIELRLREGDCLCKKVPLVQIEIRKDKSRERFSADTSMNIGHSTVLARQILSAKSIFDICSTIGITLDAGEQGTAPDSGTHR
jgi:hypothetical protein